MIYHSTFCTSPISWKLLIVCKKYFKIVQNFQVVTCNREGLSCRKLQLMHFFWRLAFHWGYLLSLNLQQHQSFQRRCTISPIYSFFVQEREVIRFAVFWFVWITVRYTCFDAAWDQQTPCSLPLTFAYLLQLKQYQIWK